MHGQRKCDILKVSLVNHLLNEAKLSPVAKRKMVATILSGTGILLPIKANLSRTAKMPMWPMMMKTKITFCLLS